MQKSAVSILVFFAFTALLLGCDSSERATSDRKPETAEISQAGRDAFLALKKLQSAVEVGVSLRDFSKMILEANFLVKTFLEGNDAQQVEDFSLAIQSAMNWYVTARNIWQIKVENDGAEVFSGNMYYQELLRAFPEAVQFAEEGPISGKKIRIDNALREVLKRADDELIKAQEFTS